MVDRRGKHGGPSLDRRAFSGGLAALGLGAALPAAPVREPAPPRPGTPRPGPLNVPSWAETEVGEGEGRRDVRTMAQTKKTARRFMAAS